MSRGHPSVVRVEKIFESAENDLTKLYTLVGWSFYRRAR